MIARWAVTLAALLMPAGVLAAPAEKAPLKLWRLDCGTVKNIDLDGFADDWSLEGKRKTITVSCYLVRHGDRYMLWDLGMSADLAGKEVMMGGVPISMGSSLVDQLAKLGINPDQVDYIAVSHMHFDHTSQAGSFPAATLLIGGADHAILASGKTDDISDPTALGPWLKGQAKTEVIRGDRDVFGDGRVTMIHLPGHTPGHFGLLVRLDKAGPVLLTGDLYHVTEEYETRSVPRYNMDRTDTLSSQNRFDAVARNLGATVIIQHEPADIAKLPAFPEGAE